MELITLRNELKDIDVTVSESNAGVPRVLTKLKSGGHYLLKYDPNATYREYVFVCAGTEHLKVVSSDDFNEFKEIKIFQGTDKKYDWVGIPRVEAPEQPSPGATSSTHSGKCLIL